MGYKSCILTAIKDEREYLEEWIKYHLDFGIDYICIIEDYDSESHKDITDKFGDKVELVNAREFLNGESFKMALHLKTTRGCNPQHLYFNVGLDYIKKYHKEIDWCFIIDNDEFLALQDGETLDGVLDLFKDYEAFSMQWECYGANGYVHKPNYGDKGVVGTYTEKMKGIVLDMPTALIKACYNMHTYKQGYFYSQHRATHQCKWCNTDFAFQSFLPTYSHIYIKHYITRSLEEYLWKKETRGCQTRIDTHLDFFFTINPDMADRKEEYIRAVRNEALVATLYSSKYSNGDSLRKRLDAWKKNCTFRYRFLVLGDADEELSKEYPWAEFIYNPTNGAKDENEERKKTFVRNYFSSYKDFVWVSENFVPTKPFKLEEMELIPIEG